MSQRDLVDEAIPRHIQHLKECVNRMLEVQASPEVSDICFRDHDKDVETLCYILECIFSDALKSQSMFSSPTCWDYFCGLGECLPAGKEFIKQIGSIPFSTQLAKGRAFLRLSLNQGLLEDHLAALLWNGRLTQAHYNEASMLRREEFNALIPALLKPLSNLRFELVPNSRRLDQADLYDNLLAQKRKGAQQQSPKSAVKIAKKKVKRTPTKVRIIKTEPDAGEARDGDTEQLQESIQTLQNRDIDQKIELEKAAIETRALKLRLRQSLEDIKDLKHELSIYKKYVLRVQPTFRLSDIDLSEDEEESTHVDTEIDTEEERLWSGIGRLLERASTEVAAIRRADEATHTSFSRDDNNGTENAKQSAQSKEVEDLKLLSGCFDITSDDSADEARLLIE